MRSRSIALLVVLFATVMTVVAQDGKGMPQGENELFAYAQKNSNRQSWRKADQAYLLLLEKYPETKLRMTVYERLGQLHLYRSKRYPDAAKWYERIIKEYPEQEQAWRARLQRAEVHARMRETAKAVELLRYVALNAPSAQLKKQASGRVLGIQNKHFGLTVRQSFSEGQRPHVQVSVRNIESADMRMDRVAYPDVLERLGASNFNVTAAAMSAANRTKVKAWDAHFSQRKDRWANHKIELPATESGVYLVEAKVEGITFRVTVLVNKYGLITKRAMGEMVVFAQGRRDSAPVSGMKVRWITASGTRERATDDSGVAVFTGTAEPGIFVGQVGEEYCFVPLQSQSAVRPESRVYITTDRPIYRPGQKVQFKLLHRVDEDGAFALHPGLKLRATITDTKNNTVHGEDLTLGDFGSAHGSFELALEPPLGHYTIRVEPIGSMPGKWNRWANQLTFRVDEYRKPEFEVKVDFSKPRYIMGEKLEGLIEARYFFGSPVANAKVQWEIRRNQHWSSWYVKPVWQAWYGDASHRSYGYGDAVRTGSGTTDAQGRLAVSFDVPRADRDQTYSLVAKVTDLARRLEQGVGGVVAHRANVAVNIKTDRYVYMPDDKVAAEVAVRDHDGRPVAGSKVRVKALRRVWSRFTSKYREIELTTVDARTGANGTVRVELPGLDPGSIVLRAEAWDVQKRQTSAERWVWVTARDWDGGTMNWRGISIVPDKESYKPGETATFLVTSEVKDMYLLFTLEATRIYHRQVIKLNGHAATLRVKLDDPGLLPNFFASIVSLHGNKTFRRDLNIVIDPTSRFLDVEIKPDRKQYKPGAPASFEITTRDSEGNPVAAEVELAAVDEAIYALQPELVQDIRKFFVRRRWSQVATTSSVQYWDWGQADMDEEVEMEESKSDGAMDMGAPKMSKARGLAGSADTTTAFVEAKVRTKFADTLLWRPTVVTGPDGKAKVDLAELTDNLTTWRLTARGMDMAGRMGQRRSSILVRKEVIARLQTPRFFTQGDRTTITAIVRNDLNQKKQVKIEIAAEGLDLDGEQVVLREVGPKQEVRVEWRARVERPGEVRFVLKALTDTESDALERKVPILPYGSMEWTSKSGIMAAESVENFTLDADGIPEASELTIVVTPTHAATVLDALDYLAGYPYGCVEQTMSRFLPSTITRQVLRRLEIKKPWLEEELPLMIRAGLDRLSGFQHPDGGWGWWKNDQSNPFTTAYVVYGLAMAQQADVKVDPGMLQRGTEALVRMMPLMKTPEERVYALYALSAARRSLPDVRNALADGVGKMPAAAQAMLALVLHRERDKKEARRVLDVLISGAQEIGATVHWAGAKGYRWTGSRVEATALSLEALLAIDPDNELVPKVVAWLALNRDGQRWISTRQTALVVMAMAGYLEKSGTAAPDMKLTLEVNDKVIWTRAVTPTNWALFESKTVISARDLAAGENKIVLRREGKGAPVYSIFLKQFRRRAQFAPSTGGLQVSREYALIANGKRVPLKSSRTLQSGDEVEVTLTVKSERSYDYLMLEDPMPSGFEAIRSQQAAPWRRGRWMWAYWWSNKEFRDEKVSIAVTHLPAGERKVTYRMRAEQPGLFRVLPTTIWNMYLPGEGANGASAVLEVVPGDS